MRYILSLKLVIVTDIILHAQKEFVKRKIGIIIIFRKDSIYGMRAYI